MNTATSAASKATNSLASGSASANHGSSHSPYCGEYTLFVSRKSATRGKPNVQAGKSGSRDCRAAQTIPASTTSASAEAGFSTSEDHEHAPVPCSRSHATNHRLSQSAPRPPLNRKNVAQECGAARANGRFVTSHAAAAPPAIAAARPRSPRRSRPITKGTTSRAG